MTSQTLNVLDIMKHLDKSNCRECGVPTCMAFAAMVLQGEKKLEDCPRLEDDSLKHLSGRISPKEPADSAPEDILEALKRELAKIDFSSAEERTGAVLENNRLAVRCLGKVFELDKQGELHTLCHINPYVHLSVISYVIHCKGKEATGEWVSFKALRGASRWVRFFEHRCEMAFQHLAERNPETLMDIFWLFSSRTNVDDKLECYKFHLYPLPNVPVQFHYTVAEPGIPASLSILFDRSVEDNLPAGTLFFMIRGLVEMFTRILQRHGNAF